MRSLTGWLFWGALALPAACSTNGGVDAAVGADATATDAASVDDTSARAAAAAEAFLATLRTSERSAVSFAYDDAAQRARGSNFPTGLFARTGLKLGVLSETQQTALFALLRVILSDRGYAQGLATVQADEVRVCDAGAGVPAELAPQRFEPFVTGSAEGSGLGLYVARAVARAHDGELDSARVDGWTVFSLRLPRGDVHV